MFNDDSFVFIQKMEHFSNQFGAQLQILGQKSIFYQKFYLRILVIDQLCSFYNKN